MIGTIMEKLKNIIKEKRLIIMRQWMKVNTEKKICLIIWMLSFILCIANVIIINYAAKGLEIHNFNAIKAGGMALYFVLYYLLGLWTTPASISIMGILMVGVFVICKKMKFAKKLSFNKAIVCTNALFCILATIVFLFWYLIVRIGYVPINYLQNIMAGECITLLAFLGVILIEFYKELFLYRGEQGKNIEYLSKFLIYILVLSMIPILFISKYVFPQADDWTFSATAHLAWESTHSIFQVLIQVFLKIKEAYLIWQGTFSSIFMMALQPAIWTESLYHIVPIFLISILSVSIILFGNAVLIKHLKMERKIAYGVYILAILFIVQTIPWRVSAFFWYNGAIHYLFAQCIVLITLSFMIRSMYTSGNRYFLCILGACIGSIYVGGSNFVTNTFIMALIIIALIAAVILKKRIKVSVWLPALFYTIAMIINFLAPGNFNKMKLMQDSAQIYSLPQAVLISFVTCIEYVLGDWTSWALFFYILILIPMVIVGIKKVKYNFKHPVLFVLGSFCLLSSTFAFPLYTTGTIAYGRCKNVIYFSFILILTACIVYLAGYINNKIMKMVQENKADLVTKETKEVKKMNIYFISVCLLLLVSISLTGIASPDEFLSTEAIMLLQNGDAKAYGETYKKNLDIIKNSKEKVVTVHALPIQPKLFWTNEISPWKEGLRLFYDKEYIDVVE